MQYFGLFYHINGLATKCKKYKQYRYYLSSILEYSKILFKSKGVEKKESAVGCCGIAAKWANTERIVCGNEPPSRLLDRYKDRGALILIVTVPGADATSRPGQWRKRGPLQQAPEAGGGNNAETNWSIRIKVLYKIRTHKKTYHHITLHAKSISGFKIGDNRK